MVSKNKRYQFSEQNLKFEELKNTPGRKVINTLVFLFITSMLALVILVFTKVIFGSPYERLLQNKVQQITGKFSILEQRVDYYHDILTQNHYANDNFYRGILGLDSLPVTIRDAGTGGTEKYTKFDNLQNAEKVKIISQKIDIIKNQLRIQENSYNLLSDKAEIRLKQMAQIPAILPISVKELIFISSYFGVRQDPFTGSQKAHYGIDYVGKKGTKIYATGDGIVTLSENSRNGYGNEIVIDHGFGYSTCYGHLKKIMVNEGETVKRGQVIGLMGNSGRSTGTHLHYEIRHNNNPVNPVYYYSDDLTGEEYEQIVKQSN
ncbi:MAG: M23 family metallopeptidase [Bacteroidales bacterium]|nr:M23 family metallopeptidase [Bacteroidales bacterium]